MIRFCVILAVLLLPSCSCGQTYSSRLPGSLNGLARQKAYKAASMDHRWHIGGTLGGADAEGIGWSTRSAEHAEAKCCFSGSPVSAKRGPYRTRLGTGVVYNQRTGIYYACILVAR